MTRPKTQRGALSVGQLARRWGLGPDRVRRLVESGLLPGSFKVPSAGKYGEAIRIPLSTILQAEQDWAILMDHLQRTSGTPRRLRRGSPAALRHFSELTDQHAAESREDERH